MALYEYRCAKCKRTVEIQMKIGDEAAPLCCEEDCGSIPMQRILSAGSFHLIGGGWASDGYSKKS